MRPSHMRSILDRELASTASQAHTPVMLWGPPGVGKSQIIAQIAAEHGVPLIDIRLSQMEPTDLRGVPFRKGDLVEWSVPSLLPDAARDHVVDAVRDTRATQSGHASHGTDARAVRAARRLDRHTSGTRHLGS